MCRLLDIAAEFLSPLPEWLWNIVPFPQKEIAKGAFNRVSGCTPYAVLCCAM